MSEVPFGPNGQTVYERTYSRPLPHGGNEDYPATVLRVVEGNLALVYGDDIEAWPDSAKRERELLIDHMMDFRIIPAGRHLWATGAKGRQYLMNCWVSGWDGPLSYHYEFTFLRLMEGGGVGANYSSKFLERFGAPRRTLEVHIVCDPEHPDYEAMKDAGILSDEFNWEWEGAFPVEDSREGWAAALTELIDTAMFDHPVIHYQRVFDVSRVRHKGAKLKTFGGTASGPQPFAVMMHEVSRVLNSAIGYAQLTPIQAMEIDHAIAECVVSGGVRRSARMAIVRWDDPYIFEFIKCKADTGKHWTTNISVEVDDDFLFDLNTEGNLHAHRVHKAVTEAMLENGEPGYWNSSLSNEGELTPVHATNPCGEICLNSGEACCLGHVNMDAFAPTHAGGSWDEGGMMLAHGLMARFLIRATFADNNDPASRAIQDKNRRIGVGHLGVQDFVVKNGWKYSDVAVNKRSPGYHQMRELLDRLHAMVRMSASDYAFELRIPEPVKVTTVAPTGSISKLPGVGGEGIHPIYSRFFEQRIRFNMTDQRQCETVEQAERDGYVTEVDGYDASGNTHIVIYPSKSRLVDQVEAMGYSASIVEQADELTIGEMLAFQAMYQKHYADNAVSFTVNVPEGAYTQEGLASVLAKWLPELKGTTIMVDATRPQAPFTRISEQQYLAARNWNGDVLSDGIDMDCSTGACPIR